MLDYKVKIGLVAMRRNTTDRPPGNVPHLVLCRAKRQAVYPVHRREFYG